MSDDIILREKARELLQTGPLSDRRPGRIWGGPGFAGMQCMLCGVPVTQNEVVLEVEFTGGSDGAAAINPHFHVRCFSAVELARQHLEAVPGLAK